MTKSKCTALALALISIAGLASCARDRESSKPAPTAASATADFHPPVLVRTRGNYDLPAWDKAEDKEMGLNDAIDVGASHPASVAVTTRCGRVPDERIAHAFFERETLLTVARLLPVGVLTQDLSRSPTECVFEIQLNDVSHARHGYLVSARIRDEGAGKVQIQGGPGDEGHTFRGRHLNALKIRYANQRPGWARLVCSSARIEPLPFDRVLDVSLFDLRAAESSLLKSSRQNCRFLVDESAVPRDDGTNAHRTVVSNLIKVQFGDDPWWVETLPQVDQRGPLITGSTIQIADVLIHNLDEWPRTLRFPQRIYDGSLRVFDVDPAYADNLDKNWVTIGLETPTGKMPLDRHLLTVPAGQSIHVKIGFEVAHTLRCYFSWIEARVVAPIFFEDVGPHGEIRASVEVPVNEPGRVKMNPEYRVPADAPYPANRRFCSWD